MLLNCYTACLKIPPRLFSASNDFYRASVKAECNITVEILLVCLLVCLSVKRVVCDKTTETSAHVLIPYERKITSFVI